MSETPNEKKLREVHSQLNDRMSWLFTHIASTLLNTKVAVRNGTKGQETSVATELAWLPDNFRGIRNLLADVIGKLAGLQAAVEALGKRQGIDPAELAKVIDAAVEKSADKHLSEIGNYQLVRVEAPAPATEEKK